MNGDKGNRSACLYLGVGCGILIVLVLAVIGGVSYWGWHKAKQLEDPEARRAEVLDILGADSLPPGYHPAIGLRVPWIMDLAILSDRERLAGEDGDEDLGERVFIYFRFLRGGKADAELRDFFEGRSDDARVLREHKIDIDLDEIIGRGVLRLREAEALYVASRGRVDTDHGSNEGIATVVLIECPDDQKMRFALWQVPDPRPSGGVEQSPEQKVASLAGTPADETALAEFLDQFSYCR